MAICREVDRSGGLILYELRIKPTQPSLNEDHYSLNITGLLQQTITWYKIRHTGGQAHYYSRTGNLKQRDLNHSSLICLCFNVPGRR